MKCKEERCPYYHIHDFRSSIKMCGLVRRSVNKETDCYLPKRINELQTLLEELKKLKL